MDKQLILVGIMEEKNKGGRPSKFTNEVQEKLLEYALIGLTDKQMCAIIGVDERTLTNWKKEYAQFFLSLKEAKEAADKKVVESLWARATGEVKIQEKHEGLDANGNIIDKHVEKTVAPSDTAIIFWLKNRQPHLWRDNPDDRKGREGGKTYKFTKYKADNGN